jgi:acetyltransferase-like isoleucine patch superfamily enzyme
MGIPCTDIFSHKGKMIDPDYMARGKVCKRILSVIFLLPAWFSPHTKLRVIFHRLRGVKIGKNVEIGYFCIIGNVHPYLITIEDEAVVTAGAVLLEHDNAFYYAHGGEVKFGPVVIKKRSFVGIHSVIMPNVTIGERAIIAANSVVSINVPPNTIVGGNPAKVIKNGPDN